MGHLTLRRLLKCLAPFLIVAQLGCAGTKVEVVPAPAAPPLSEHDRQACAAFAQRRADEVGAVEQASLSFHVPGGVGAVIFYAFYTESHAREANELARKNVYAAEEETCLRPMKLTATLGPDHPDVAVALRDLANEYAYHEDYRAAQPLYPRALAIQERAFGPKSDDVATTLEWYGRLLRAMHRDEEAAAIEVRAQAIRVELERQPAP